ncbi:MAG: hypothetical protein NT001_01340, partial [Candidatus Woesearchaeota archaeon]|nr:hypothetical protein [Candidatus Woesearchaeota archaeon]
MDINSADLDLWEKTLIAQFACDELGLYTHSKNSIENLRTFYYKAYEREEAEARMEKALVDIFFRLEKIFPTSQGDNSFRNESLVRKIDSIFDGKNHKPELDSEAFRGLIMKSLRDNIAGPYDWDLMKIKEETRSGKMPRGFEDFKSNQFDCLSSKLECDLYLGALGPERITEFLKYVIFRETSGPENEGCRSIKGLEMHSLYTFNFIDILKRLGTLDKADIGSDRNPAKENMITERILYCLARGYSERAKEIYKRYRLFSKDRAKLVLENIAKENPDFDDMEKMYSNTVILAMQKILKRSQLRDFSFNEVYAAFEKLIYEEPIYERIRNPTKGMTAQQQAVHYLDSIRMSEKDSDYNSEKLPCLASLIERHGKGIIPEDKVKRLRYALETVPEHLLWSLNDLLETHPVLWDYMKIDKASLVNSCIKRMGSNQRIIEEPAQYGPCGSDSSIGGFFAIKLVNSAYAILKRMMKEGTEPDEELAKRVIFMSIAANSSFETHSDYSDFRRADEIYSDPENQRFIDKGMVKKFLMNSIGYFKREMERLETGKHGYVCEDQVDHRREKHLWNIFGLAKTNGLIELVKDDESVRPYIRLNEFL